MNVDHADHTLLGNQRDSQFRTDQWIGIDVSRLLAYVLNHDCPALLHRHSCNALANFNFHAFNFGRMPNLEPHAQLLRALIQKEDGKDLVIDHLAHQLGNSGQELVHLQRAVQGVSDIDEEILEL